MKTKPMILTLAVLLVPTASAIEIVTQPADLLPGHSYWLAFPTSNPHRQDTASLFWFDQWVSDEANAEPKLLALGVNWSAIVSVVGTDARDHTNTNPTTDGPGVPIYNLQGERIADGNADLWDGTLAHGIEWHPQGFPPLCLNLTGCA